MPIEPAQPPSATNRRDELIGRIVGIAYPITLLGSFFTLFAPVTIVEVAQVVNTIASGIQPDPEALRPYYPNAWTSLPFTIAFAIEFALVWSPKRQRLTPVRGPGVRVVTRASPGWILVGLTIWPIMVLYLLEQGPIPWLIAMGSAYLLLLVALIRVLAPLWRTYVAPKRRSARQRKVGRTARVLTLVAASTALVTASGAIWIGPLTSLAELHELGPLGLLLPRYVSVAEVAPTTTLLLVTILVVWWLGRSTPKARQYENTILLSALGFVAFVWGFLAMLGNLHRSGPHDTAESWTVLGIVLSNFAICLLAFVLGGALGPTRRRRRKARSARS